MKIKVKATSKYEELGVQDAELGKMPKAGEEFEVSEERYKELSGANTYKVAFVEKIETKTEAKTDKKETKDSKGKESK